jgi:DNA mismatch repair protein MutL
MGTRVEVTDLFSATPARLKFLKNDRTEYAAVKDTVVRLAMGFPHVAFRLTHDGKVALNLPAVAENGQRGDNLPERLCALIDRNFIDSAMAIDAERPTENGGITLHGFAGLPTYDRGTGQHQYLFVNGRPVRDRLLNGALRGAYADVMARDRQPVAVFFLHVPKVQVDVMVLTAMAVVLFLDYGLVRGLIVSAIRHALHRDGRQTASTVSFAALGAFQHQQPQPYQMPLHKGGGHGSCYPSTATGLAEKTYEADAPLYAPAARTDDPPPPHEESPRD